MLELVILDSTVVANSPQVRRDELLRLCRLWQDSGVRVALVATHNAGLSRGATSAGAFAFDDLLSGQEVFGRVSNEFKGGGRRVTELCTRLHVTPARTLYLGDDHYDYTSALHAGCCFVMAGWVPHPRGFQGVVADDPFALWRYSSHYLMQPARWSYTLDDADRGFRLRALLSANTLGQAITLAGNPPHDQFNLIQLIKNQEDISSGKYPAGQVLFWHALTSLIQEGLCPPGSIFTVFPSSVPGELNPVVARLADYSSRIAGTYFYGDLLVRARRVARSREEKLANRDRFTLRANSVHVNPLRRARIPDKTVVVFDDFHTTGKSLDWARLLLRAAGASKVIGVALGKFGSAPHEFHDPLPNTSVQAFSCHEYEETDFQVVLQPLARHSEGRAIIPQSFERLILDQAYAEPFAPPL